MSSNKKKDNNNSNSFLGNKTNHPEEINEKNLNVCHICNKEKEKCFNCSKCKSNFCLICIEEILKNKEQIEEIKKKNDNNNWICLMCEKICPCEKCNLKDNKCLVCQNNSKNNVNIEDKIKELNFIPKTFADEQIDEAQIIVAAGKGAIDCIELVKLFAEQIGGKFAVSRSLVDLGLFKNDIQVGQTGKTVTPKIYIACGISGAIQHIEGMKNSEMIIAINSDKDAPIFKIADYGIVGDLNEVLPKLIERK